MILLMHEYAWDLCSFYVSVTFVHRSMVGGDRKAISVVSNLWNSLPRDDLSSPSYAYCSEQPLLLAASEAEF